MFIEDTIAGIATPPGEGGIGIIRISGPRANSILDSIFSPKRKIKVSEMRSHTLYYGWIKEKDEVIDEVLAVKMPAPHSYTKEDVVEIHCHGGMIPISRILQLCLHSGCRMAEPGEFTKRAFLNGRIDLAQAEAVMDLIQSKTDTAAKSSMEQLEGTLSQWVNQVQEQLLDMLALIEVNVDYPEEDTEEATMDEILPQVEAITLRLEELIKTADTGRVLREGLKTAIIGRPNVGKSSLLNALLRENRAIVTEIPGTTRDLLEEYLNIRGILLRIIDTAGIRNTDDIVEAMGVERSRESIQRADLILYILDVAEELQDEDMSIMKELKDKQCIIVLNKIDKPARVTEEKIRAFFPEKKIVSVSALNREGIDELENEIYQMVFQGRVQSTGHVMVTNTRHKDALERAVRALKESKKSIEMRMPLDCIAIDIRDAWHCLGEITGETVDEDVIDRIFSKFCLGK